MLVFKATVVSTNPLIFTCIKNFYPLSTIKTKKLISCYRKISYLRQTNEDKFDKLNKKPAVFALLM